MGEQLSLADKEIWINSFIQSEKFPSIKNKVNDYVCKMVANFLQTEFDVPWDETSKSTKLDYVTPREVKFLQNILYLEPFYILEYISQRSNDTIFDIGCGSNFFKNFYNVVGIDPYHPNADIKDKFDANFILNYKGTFSNAIAINSIHFCSYFELEKQLSNFIELVKPNGFIYITLNFQRIMETTLQKIEKLEANSHSQKILLESLKLKNTHDLYCQNPSEKVNFIDNIVKNLKDYVILYENKVIEYPDCSHNGNVKLLIKRKEGNE